MSKKVGSTYNMILWSLFVVSFFPLFNHADVDLKAHAHAQDEIIETFQIDGDIIDCIDIYKQPAFKHPLLINHTIQLKPTSYPEAIIEQSKTNGVPDEFPVGVSRPWSLPKSCPEGSIPLRRVERLTNGHSGNNDSSSDQYVHPPDALPQSGVEKKKFDPKHFEHSVVHVAGGVKYTAGKAAINVAQPNVETASEFSTAQLWVYSSDRKISLEAGLTVNPLQYGDKRTRFFILWTTNGYQTYCYNLDCPGFVQTNRLVGLSSFIVPVSSVGGPQYTVDLEIFQDLSTKHWWVRLQGTDMGYWPKQLVPSFQSAGADGFDFGGRVLNTRPNGHHTSTGMGLGRFPTEGLGKAAFFRNVEIAYADYERGKYNFPGQAHPASDVPGCYFVQEGGDFHGPWVYHFYYGGPGRGNSCS